METGVRTAGEWRGVITHYRQDCLPLLLDCYVAALWSSLPEEEEKEEEEEEEEGEPGRRMAVRAMVWLMHSVPPDEGARITSLSDAAGAAEVRSLMQWQPLGSGGGSQELRLRAADQRQVARLK